MKEKDWHGCVKEDTRVFDIQVYWTGLGQVILLCDGRGKAVHG